MIINMNTDTQTILNQLVKSGYKSTEFWAAFIEIFIYYLTSCLGIKIPPDVVTWVGVTTAAYIVGRSAVKIKAISTATTINNLISTIKPSTIDIPNLAPTGFKVSSTVEPILGTDKKPEVTV